MYVGVGKEEGDESREADRYSEILIVCLFGRRQDQQRFNPNEIIVKKSETCFSDPPSYMSYVCFLNLILLYSLPDCHPLPAKPVNLG